MKRLLSTVLLIAVLTQCCLFAGCGKDNDVIQPEPPVVELPANPPVVDTPVEPPATAEPEKKPEPVTQPAPIVTPSLPPKTGPMSYEEFFSKERPFNDSRSLHEIPHEDGISMKQTEIERELRPSGLDGNVISECEIYNGEDIIFKGLVRNDVSRSSNYVYLVPKENSAENSTRVLQIDFEGNVRVLVEEGSSSDIVSVQASLDDVLFFSIGRNLYRYYEPENVLELYFIMPFDDGNFLLLSTTDIHYWSITEREDGTLSTGTVRKGLYFYSSLTQKSYDAHYGRMAINWEEFRRFCKLYLGVDLEEEGVHDFKMFKEKYIVPRGESMDSLRVYCLIDYAGWSEYLWSRGEDLIAMGINPHKASTFRYPEDSMFFRDQRGKCWVE